MMDDRAIRREARRRKNPWMALVTGLSILAFGLIAWLDQLGRIDAHDYFRWWPLILVATSLAHLARRQWIGGIIWMCVALMFMPSIPLVPDFRFWKILGLWPLLITAGGLTLIGQALRGSGSGERFHTFAWMGGNGSQVTSADLAGGDAVAVMGGCDINLTSAKIVTMAEVDVVAFWGGIELRVPKDWVIENRVIGLLGGSSNRTSNPTEGDGPRLIVRGSAIMGGVEIRNAKEVTA